MLIQRKQVKSFLVLSLTEEIKGDRDGDDLALEIEKVVKEGHRFIALQFGHVSYIYSGIIKVIVKFFKEMERRGGKLTIVETNKSLYDVLEVIGVTKVMTIYRTVEEFEREVDKAEV